MRSIPMRLILDLKFLIQRYFIGPCKDKAFLLPNYAELRWVRNLQIGIRTITFAVFLTKALK